MSYYTQLLSLQTTVAKTALSNVVKAKKDLWNWILAETQDLGDVSVSERIYYVLLNKPNIICQYGNRQKFVAGISNYKFCGNTKYCQCFRELCSENNKSLDVETVLRKRKITWMEKYGVDNAAKSKQVIQKRRETMKSRDYTNQRKKTSYNKESIGFEQVILRVSSSVTPLFTRDTYTGSSRKNLYPWQCNFCTHIFESHIDYGTVPKCLKCFPRTRSNTEIILTEWLNEYQVVVEPNNRIRVPGNELDLWLPDFNIAIEVNGVYWHSTKHKHPLYHVKKMIACQDSGVHLIQIFDDEMENKPEIVKSRILSYLGKNHKTFARKLKVVELDKLIYSNFLKTHHLQGVASASVKLGLIDSSGKLHAVMSFSKSRYTNHQYEMIRYCSDGNVVGGASKLFSYFIKNYDPDSIVSYANRCWSNGKLYQTLGFNDETVDKYNVGFWYFNRYKRIHRSNLTKKKLVQIGHPDNKTADEIIDELGYLKVYDCGNLKYTWYK